MMMDNVVSWITLTTIAILGCIKLFLMYVDAHTSNKDDNFD